MANAQEVLAQLNNTWSSMLDKFYDSVADEYLSWMAKEYNVELKTLKEKALPLKAKLLAKATDSMHVVKTTKKPTVKPKVNDSSKYGTLSRKELVELCKERSIPVKRKNQDMIDLLKKSDDENENEQIQEPESVQENNDNSDVEPEIATKPKVTKTIKKKHSEPTVSKNELLEETIESSDDED